MNDKLLLNPEVYVKVFNLLNFLEANCNYLIDINFNLIPSDDNHNRLINKNLEALKAVQNKIIVIKAEVAEQTKKHIAILENFEPVNNDDTKLARALKTLEMLSAEILEETYYVNQNGKIIK